MQYLKSNCKFLRELSGKSQSQLSVDLGFSRSTWNNYELGKSTPSLEDFVKMAKYFGHSETDMLHTDLQNVALNEKSTVKKSGQNVALNVAPNVALTGKNEAEKLPLVAEERAIYGAQPVTISGPDIVVKEGSVINVQLIIKTRPV